VSGFPGPGDAGFQVVLLHKSGIVCQPLQGIQVISAKHPAAVPVEDLQDIQLLAVQDVFKFMPQAPGIPPSPDKEHHAQGPEYGRKQNRENQKQDPGGKEQISRDFLDRRWWNRAGGVLDVHGLIVKWIDRIFQNV
jgi:hypothetical protein